MGFLNIASVVMLLCVSSIVFAKPKVFSDVIPIENNDLISSKSEQVANADEKSIVEAGLQKYAGVFGGGGQDYSQELSPVGLPLPEHVRVKRFTD